MGVWLWTCRESGFSKSKSKKDCWPSADFPKSICNFTVSTLFKLIMNKLLGEKKKKKVFIGKKMKRSSDFEQNCLTER